MPSEIGLADGRRSQLIFLIARLLPNLLGVATAAVLTRLLVPTEYGEYALALSVIFFLTIGLFEWLGLSVMRMARTAVQPDLFFGTVMTCFFALFGLSVLAIALVLVLTKGFENHTMLAVACLAATFASAWFELKQRLQMAELHQVAYFWSSLGRSVITTILVCSAAYLHQSTPVIVFALAVGILVPGLITREPRLDLFRFQFDWAVCRRLLRFGFPLSLSIGLATILMSIDKWLLQGLVGAHSVGLFTVAALIIQTPVLALANGVGPSALSVAVQTLEFRSAESTRAQLAQNFSGLLSIILPAATGVIALSSNLAHVMVGPAYWPSVILLAPWLAAAGILASIRTFYIDFAFQLAHKTSPLIWIMFVTLAVNILLDFWLIPTQHELGAAIASFSALFLGLILAAISSRRVFRLPVPFMDIAKIVASTGIMFMVLYPFVKFTGGWALVCQVGGGVFIYLCGMIAFNAIGTRTWLRQHLAAG